MFRQGSRVGRDFLLLSKDDFVDAFACVAAGCIASRGADGHIIAKSGVESIVEMVVGEYALGVCARGGVSSVIVVAHDIRADRSEV